MDFQRLKTFQTVATLMNFNRAAEILHYAQSTVSAQIKALEQEVGAPLFERTGRQVRLTTAGERMLGYADRILSIREEAMADLDDRREAEGVLTIRAPQTVSTYYLPAVLAAFQPRYPNVRLDVNSCAFHPLEKELRIGTVDLAFLLAESIQSARLQVEMVASERLVVVAAPGHPLTRRRIVGYEDLAQFPVFLPKADCGYRMDFEQALTARRIESVTVMEFNSIEAIKRCIRKGLGVTLIPQIAVREELASGALVAVPWHERPEVAVLLIWHKARWLSPMVSAFLETVRKVASR